MKRNKYLVIVACIIVLLPVGVTFGQFFSASAACGNEGLNGYHGGDGSEEHPHQICFVEQLNKIRNNPHLHYILVSNLDFEDPDSYNDSTNMSDYTEGKGWTPIGTEREYRFTGTFEGQNYIISNLYINRKETNYIGLFGWAGREAVISNVGLKNVDITGTASYVGSLVGFNGGKIFSSYSQGSVTGQTKNTVHTGGLVGRNHRGKITDSYSTANVTSKGEKAGVGDGVYAGGLVGLNWAHSSILGSYSSGSVTAEGVKNVYAGGLGGRSYGGRIINSYSTGSVIGKGKKYVQAGGLVGNVESAGKIINSYSTGSVTGRGEEFAYVGGFVGSNATIWFSIPDEEGILNSFWDTEASRTATGIGGGDQEGVTGKTTLEMQAIATFLEAGWDIVIKENRETEIWFIEENDYPKLGWES